MPVIFKQLSFMSCCWQTKITEQGTSFYIYKCLTQKHYKEKFQASKFKFHIQVSIFFEQIT